MALTPSADELPKMWICASAVKSASSVGEQAMCAGGAFGRGAAGAKRTCDRCVAIAGGYPLLTVVIHTGHDHMRNAFAMHLVNGCPCACLAPDGSACSSIIGE